MDTRTISIVLLKITGLVLLVICVSQLPGYFPLTGRGYEFSIGEVLATAAVALVPLSLIGLALWFFPGTVANKIVSPSPESAIADSRAIELVALTVLGVYLVADGLVGATRDVAIVILANRQDASSSLLPTSVVAHIAATVVQLLVGSGLCIGAKGVLRVIERLRQ
jgi:hypothetical protein